MVVTSIGDCEEWPQLTARGSAVNMISSPDDSMLHR